MFRIVDRELLSSHASGDSHQVFTQIAAILVLFSAVMSIPAFDRGGGFSVRPCARGSGRRRRPHDSLRPLVPARTVAVSHRLRHCRRRGHPGCDHGGGGRTRRAGRCGKLRWDDRRSRCLVAPCAMEQSSVRRAGQHTGGFRYRARRSSHYAGPVGQPISDGTSTEGFARAAARLMLTADAAFIETMSK